MIYLRDKCSECIQADCRLKILDLSTTIHLHSILVTFSPHCQDLSLHYSLEDSSQLECGTILFLKVLILFITMKASMAWY